MTWVLRALRRSWDRPGDQMHDLGYRRSWREDLEVTLDRKTFEIALYNYLVAWMNPKGETHSQSEADPQPVGWLLFQMRFFEWRLGQQHIYYDGCHCSWYLGPIQIHRSCRHWCKKCVGDK